MSALTDALIEQQLNTLAILAKSTIKNEKSKKRFKSVFLKLFRMLRAAYADDPDFE